MKNIKILIGNDIPEEGMSWADSLKSENIYVITRSANSLLLFDYISLNGFPDVIVMEAKMKGMDAPEFIKFIFENTNMLPIIIVLGSLDQSAVIERALETGASCGLCKPIDADELKSSINEAYSHRKTTDQNYRVNNSKINEVKEHELMLEDMVTDVILRIGIPAHIKGYQYLRHSIILCVKNRDLINYMTKLLYPSTAMCFGTTATRVERAIRNAISTAWDRGDKAALNKYFGFTSMRKPTNAEFIALIADKLRLQLKAVLHS